MGSMKIPERSQGVDLAGLLHFCQQGLSQTVAVVQVVMSVAQESYLMSWEASAKMWSVAAMPLL